MKSVFADSCISKISTHFLSGKTFVLIYAPVKLIPGWSIRKTSYSDDKPVRFEYVCPYCGYTFEPVTMQPGWKGCTCVQCDAKSDFTVSWLYPHGYRYGDNLNDGKQLLDDGYFTQSGGLDGVRI